ncbi:unnamed protein product [Thelazia callipaeda]|uniref:RAD51 associated protein 2 n=1 Tax=Thelazia callipaeda TaxID=103827 RepID=A0A0N5D837_THECL|nr:unnamed protein product [Thelazia callipaeda]
MKVTKPKQTVAPILGRPVYDAFESDLEKRKVITPIRCSFDSSNKVISNKKVLNSLTDKNKEEVNMDHCYHSNSPVLNVISQSSNKSWFISCSDMERNCEKELENSITYTHSSIATHHVTDDKSLIHLCDAWKDFRVASKFKSVILQKYVHFVFADLFNIRFSHLLALVLHIEFVTLQLFKGGETKKAV